IKNFIKRNTPTQPDLKSELISLQERERQRLESLRKKQEAEEQRKKKVEEEKRRRQAEMKQKREERLRKALQARERVEQMEEEKKKRMEQKTSQNDEKVRLSQVREEKVAEERSKKKLPKKHGEADAWKQKALRVEDEFEQQEPLQRRREDEVKEKGKKVLELKNLVEQQQVEQEEESPKVLHQQPGQEKRAKQPESIAVASNTWLQAVKVSMGSRDLVDLDLRKERSHFIFESRVWVFSAEEDRGTEDFLQGPQKIWLGSRDSRKSISTSYLGPPKGTKESRSPKVNANNYGMDLNSDDSTDDENEPRKPVPAWADGSQLNQAILHQYYHPVNVDQLFGLIPSPKLEDIFGKSKPRYFKRTSSAVWHSPP
ncbi:UNVERIFIED_CONTAM: Inner centromere protein, partial [Eudyptes pachyrhynchus]